MLYIFIFERFEDHLENMAQISEVAIIIQIYGELFDQGKFNVERWK